MKRTCTVLLLGIMVIVLACSDVWAQATAQVSGTVRDQSGAVLPGVEVSATQTETGAARNTITNETGTFVLPNLPLGPYRLEAALTGFRTFAQTGIVLQVNSNVVINAVLEVGQLAETVEVQANAAIVETRNSGVGQVIENERILDLPLNGRNVAELITLAGAAVQVGETGNRTFAGSPILSVGGGLGFGTAYMLDGANNTDPYNGQSLPLPFPDALQEFKVETSGLSAQHGKGTSVGTVTKAGTNAFHGTLFEFVRNDLFNARSYFAEKNSTLKRHQFGGTVGGPIVRNRLFFFAGYQGTTLRQDPNDTRTYIPTPAMLAGDWTAVTSPACNAGRQITLRAPFAGNRISPTQYNRAALAIVSKLPQTTDPCGEIRYGIRNIQDDGQLVGKVDYQMSDKHSMFGRYLATWSDIANPWNQDRSSLLLTSERGYDNLAQGYAFGDTYLVGPNIVNAFRLTVNRGAVHRVASEFFGPQDIGINAFTYVPKYMVVTITGAFSVGRGTGTPSTFRTTSYQLSDDVSIVRGTHQLAFGGSAIHGRVNGNSNSRSPGTYNFNGQELGLGLADFMLGRLTSLGQGGPSQQYSSESFVSLYGQDTWKATPRLTVNYGLRWEPFLPQTVRNGAVYSFDYDRFRQGIKSTVFRNAPAGFYYPGDPGFPGKRGVDNRWTNLAPRVGLAWDLQGDGRTSVRASYAYSYETVPLQWVIDSVGAPPWGNRVTLPSPQGGFENPWLGVPGGNPFPFQIDENAVFGPYGEFLFSRQDNNTPSASSWNLSIQRQLGTDWLLSSSYMGTQTSHIWVARPINPAIYIPGGSCTINGVTYPTCSVTGNTNERRRFSIERPQDGRLVGPVAEVEDGGTQSYNGLLLSLQRRATRGVSISGNYTWSHCIGDFADTNGMGPSSEETITDPNNRRIDRGNCGPDRRHVLNFTSVAQTPQFDRTALRMIASNWRMSGIYRYSSGAFLTVLSGVDRALTGVTNQRPDQVLASPYGDRSASPLTNYLNPAAFVNPPLGRLGNLGRNNIEGPGTWQLDVGLSRVFQFGEDNRLEFRAEAYNLTNSFRPRDPNTNIRQSTFGQIRNSRDPRIMQFALKYMF